MPQLVGSNIVELELPSSTEDDKAIVTIDLGIDGGVAEDMYRGSAGGRTSHVLATIIKDWNFEDEEGNKAEITPEAVRRLPAIDYMFLSNKVFDKLHMTVSAEAVPEPKKDS